MANANVIHRTIDVAVGDSDGGGVFIGVRTDRTVMRGVFVRHCDASGQ